MPVWKIFAYKKEFVFLITVVLTSFEQEWKQCFCKHLLHHINRTAWFFPYDLVTVNDYLSDTLEKVKSGTNSSLQTMGKDGQFFLDGFGTPFDIDRNGNGGDTMLFIRNFIPTKVFT